ncbi:MAG: hypothetical protein IKW45_03670 [Clostridia bacterium]|nr:hypothetical protein [Clostridia bacterium]
MSKKIIAVAILMLAIVVVFAACKKDDYEVSYTIPGDNGDVIEVYKDENGNEFVTNANGDKIPVTTDKDGFYDDITALITETTTKANKDNTTTTTKADKDNTTTSTTKADKENTTTSASSEPTTENTIIIGGEVETEASISWQEIADAAKKANKS